jgi:hypothetical protein
VDVVSNQSYLNWGEELLDVLGFNNASHQKVL